MSKKELKTSLILLGFNRLYPGVYARSSINHRVIFFIRYVSYKNIEYKLNNLKSLLRIITNE